MAFFFFFFFFFFSSPHSPPTKTLISVYRFPRLLRPTSSNCDRRLTSPTVTSVPISRIMAQVRDQDIPRQQQVQGNNTREIDGQPSLTCRQMRRAAEALLND